MDVLGRGARKGGEATDPPQMEKTCLNVIRSLKTCPRTQTRVENKSEPDPEFIDTPRNTDQKESGYLSHIIVEIIRP